jgi:hypothetical protein
VVFWRNSLAVLAIALAACTCGGVGAAPRVLAIDSATPGLQAPAERRREIAQAVQAWKLAWELGESDLYLRFYDAQYRGQARSRAQWEQERRARLARRGISVQVEAPRIRLLGESEAEVSFLQRYASASHRDAGVKRLRLRRAGGAWRISEDSWAPQP